MAAGACLASPCLLPAKGGRAACVRASVRAPRSATHLDRERPADHPLCAGRGSFEILDTDKFMALWSRGSKTSTVTSNNFKGQLNKHLRARCQVPTCVCAAPYVHAC